MKPERGYEALRRFRVSTPHSDYFLTCCTHDRQAGLTLAPLATAVREEISQLERAGYWTVRGAVIMPDHFHLLVTLHDIMTLDRVIARLKSKTRPTLSSAGLEWQGNYYEHRLRDGEAAEPVLTYLFLNPYRAGLIPVTNTWPWYWLGAGEAAWFKPLLDDGRPFQEWLR